MSGRDKLVLACMSENPEKLLWELGLLKRGGGEFSSGISRRTVPRRRLCDRVYQGRVFGRRELYPPRRGRKDGISSRIRLSRKAYGGGVSRASAEEELISKVVERSGAAVVYIKSKETISDFLSILGAESSLKKFSELVERRDEANRSNRAANCFSGNADKSATAAVRQVLAIRAIEREEGLENLETELKETARARLENPSLSLKELAEKLEISKSCLNHRMRKIEELASKISAK